MGTSDCQQEFIDYVDDHLEELFATGRPDFGGTVTALSDFTQIVAPAFPPSYKPKKVLQVTLEDNTSVCVALI